MRITSQTKVEIHLNNEVPVNPFEFASQVQSNQKLINPSKRISILFNKGRYFESNYLPQRTQDYLANQNIKIEYNGAVGSWKQLELFVYLMNTLNVYVNIKTDWV